MLQSIIRERAEALRFSLSSANSPLFIGFYKYLYRPKRNSLSELLSVYSLSRKGHFYVVQIGANDGITHDPIHKFIKRDNWHGVLLEPQAFVHDNYLQRLYAKNKGINTLRAAIGPENGTRLLYKISFCDMRWATGLASFHKEHVEKAFSSGLVAAQCAKHRIDIPSDQALISTEVVPTIRPEFLLKQYSISKIDLLQIDVEGYDFEVVRMFDIQHSRPGMINFENTHLSDSDSILCQRHLHRHGYALRNYGANTVAMLHPLGEFGKYFTDA